MLGGLTRKIGTQPTKPYLLLFDQLVGAENKHSGQLTSHRLRSFEIYYQLITMRLLYRNIGRLSSPKYLRRGLRTLTVNVGKTRTIFKQRLAAFNL